MTTKIQQRAICPCCFGEWAFDGGMSNHGYTVDRGYFSGVCPGRGAQHFGTPAGRAFAAHHANDVERWAQASRVEVAQIRSGTRVITQRGNPVDFAKKPWVYHEAADALERKARSAERDVVTIRQRVAEWVPVEPRQVEVEDASAKAPIRHLRAKVYGHTAGICARSAMGAQKMWRAFFTDDATQVTCSRCLKEIERRAAKARSAN